MRIPTLYGMWIYRNRITYINAKKVDPSGKGWAQLVSVPPGTCAYWVDFGNLYTAGIPLRDELGALRLYTPKENP